MAEDDDDSSKTEDPTPKKLEDARKKGQVPLSREINNWIMLLTGSIVILMAGPYFMSNLTGYMKFFIENPHAVPTAPGGIGVILQNSFITTLKILSFPLLLLLVGALVGPFSQVGVLFAPESLKPDISKISPMKGFKRLFSMRSLMEFLKGLLKISIIGVVGFLLIKPFYGAIDHTIGLPIPLVMDELYTLILKLMSGILVVLLVVAVIDLVYQRMSHAKKMRMTKQELKDEYKQSEGDPHIRAKLRQLRQEKARARMMQAVPEADVVITNPTHFAVALKYDPEEMSAPLVVAKGIDETALRIREVAEENDVILFENPPLARLLHKDVDIDETVPPEHFQAVAEVISYVFRLKGKLDPV